MGPSVMCLSLLDPVLVKLTPPWLMLLAWPLGLVISFQGDNLELVVMAGRMGGERGAMAPMRCLCSVGDTPLSAVSVSLPTSECSSETLLGGLPALKLPMGLLILGLGIDGGGATFLPRLEPLGSPGFGGAWSWGLMGEELVAVKGGCTFPLGGGRWGTLLDIICHPYFFILSSGY